MTIDCETHDIAVMAVDRLERRVAELEAALKPFAWIGALLWIDGSGYVTTRIRTADIVAAQKALNK